MARPEKRPPSKHTRPNTDGSVFRCIRHSDVSSGREGDGTLTLLPNGSDGPATNTFTRHTAHTRLECARAEKTRWR
ncbi:uncharacterized protein LOC101451899 [Anopheles sinensis]|uniref:Uncharacterized protein LOC101451899 n=1 Tax=Anopheles sinensis TaxID=74873 RepID=A0A084VNH7_ANOSI|nr:uncharacterized protein LOC101451899 [Anopheles sinensis]